MAAAHEMRVSDAEREVAAGELREHFATGRLTPEELDERLTAAFAARTRGDLSALFTDLPSDSHGGNGSGVPVTADAYAGWQAHGGHGGWQAHAGAGRTSRGPGMSRLILASALLWTLFIVGILGVFGIGAGRPFGIALILAAFALLRRLVFIVIGRRRTGRGGPRRGGGPRRRGGPRRHR